MLRCRPISPAAAAEPAMSIAIGIVVGLILALTGAGGTIVAVPLLMFGLHLEVATAAPIALLVVCAAAGTGTILGLRLEEHTSELQSLMRISYAVFCLKKKNKIKEIK